MPILIVQVRDGSSYLRYYNQARINNLNIKFCGESILYLTLFVIFWACVGCSWICLRRLPSEMSVAVYATIVIIFVILVFVHSMVLPNGCEVAEMMSNVVRLHKLKGKVSFCKLKSFRGKLVLTQVNALVPIRMYILRSILVFGSRVCSRAFMDTFSAML